MTVRITSVMMKAMMNVPNAGDARKLLMLPKSDGAGGAGLAAGGGFGCGFGAGLCCWGGGVRGMACACGGFVAGGLCCGGGGVRGIACAGGFDAGFAAMRCKL